MVTQKEIQLFIEMLETYVLIHRNYVGMIRILQQLHETGLLDEICKKLPHFHEMIKDDHSSNLELMRRNAMKMVDHFKSQQQLDSYLGLPKSLIGLKFSRIVNVDANITEFEEDYFIDHEGAKYNVPISRADRENVIDRSSIMDYVLDNYVGNSDESTCSLYVIEVHDEEPFTKYFALKDKNY